MPTPQPPTLLTPDWSTSYPLTLRSPRLARLHTRRQLTLWNWTGDIDDAVLVTSELVTNAAVHGRLPGHELWLRLAVSDGGVLSVEVSDPSLAFPVARVDSGGREGGRGLLVVRELGAELDWFLRADVGKTVRARLAPASASAPAISPPTVP
ncbi:ATP-binding protein [Streptomyces cylindrosporus]|uniref:ATP-binding protein n=1 Tax=Streptomyces cylindrosporus TaxID=2927583 RepID=A0ABS9XXB8_9ACTN|nr:ATP-binding protein [Streptomyces cylindrosporus]MCI3269607.1 ATP-binding protein [Streptomyces cylindrosporus]